MYKIPLPHFARQIWKNETKFKWWVKYYIERNHHDLKPVDVIGEYIICERKGITCKYSV
jgi:hypothetical protein